MPDHPETRWGMGLRRADAARYIGVSETMFDELRRDDPRFPKPVTIIRETKVYLRSQLDDYLRELSFEEVEAELVA